MKTLQTEGIPRLGEADATIDRKLYFRHTKIFRSIELKCSWVKGRVGRGVEVSGLIEMIRKWSLLNHNKKVTLQKQNTLTYVLGA